jgi:hypothetical protein
MTSPTRVINELIENKRRVREATAALGHDLGRFSSQHPLVHQSSCRHCDMTAQVYREPGGFWERGGQALTTSCVGHKIGTT